MPWSAWTYNAVLDGSAIPPEKRKEHIPEVFADLTYKFVQDRYSSDQTKDFDWGIIVEDHSGAGSSKSALVSTPLEWSVAVDFANPYLLVLDVCPERALAVFSGNIVTLGEAEIYLPLFLLPEEITTVLKVPAMDPFYQIPSTYTRLNPLTKSMRKNFFNRDLPFDVQYLTQVAQMNPISDSGMPNQEAYARHYKKDAYYDLILSRYNSGHSIDRWRSDAMTRILQTNTDPKVCDFAYREYVDSGTFRMGKEPPSGYEPDGKPERKKAGKFSSGKRIIGFSVST